MGTLVSDFAGVDPTVFSYQGRWWIMCTNQEAGANARVYLWYAQDLHGPWLPHPANPVERGRNGARPTGTLFLHGGDLYRPSMDSTRTYGKRVDLNKVTKLTTTEFAEEPVRIVEPFAGRYRDGIHTLSALGGKRSLQLHEGASR